MKISEPAEWTAKLHVDCPYCYEGQEVDVSEIDNSCDIAGLREPEDAIDVNLKYKCKITACAEEFIINETVY